MNIVILKNGNVFDYHSDEVTLVHCIDSTCAFGTSNITGKEFRNSIAYQINERYKSREYVLNSYNSHSTGDCLYQDDFNIFHLVTKDLHFKKPSLITLETCLVSLRVKCKYRDIHKIIMPQIGCGLDGLNWEDVLYLIEKVFKEVDIKISITTK